MTNALIHLALGAVGGTLAMFTGEILGTQRNLLLWGCLFAIGMVAIIAL